jgi:N-acetylglutamate synthase-like GNAT family acetyltransferase
LAEHPHRFILLAEIDGRPVGVSSLHTHAKSGWLRGAAVVPDARGRGIQRAMISARVALAIEHGCDLVGAWAEPDKFSSANLEQLGLRQVGTRDHYRYKPQPSTP